MAGCMKNVVVFSYAEPYLAEVFQGEPAEVDLSTLAVAEGYAVVGHGGMFGAEASYGDGLQSADAAIVFDVSSSHSSDGVGDAGDAFPFRFFDFDGLGCVGGWHWIFARGGHHYLFDFRRGECAVWTLSKQELNGKQREKASEFDFVHKSTFLDFEKEADVLYAVPFPRRHTQPVPD